MTRYKEYLDSVFQIDTLLKLSTLFSGDIEEEVRKFEEACYHVIRYNNMEDMKKASRRIYYVNMKRQQEDLLPISIKNFQSELCQVWTYRFIPRHQHHETSASHGES